jgi:hypothetical protein
MVYGEISKCWHSCSTTFPIASRATLTVFGDWQVKIRSWLVPTLEAFQRKRGLVSIQCGLLRRFEGPIKILNDNFKYVICLID